MKPFPTANKAAGWLIVVAMQLASFHALALTPDKFYAKTAPSVWHVFVYDADGLAFAQGSAVVIGKETLLTNCHVLAKAKRISVRQDNTTYDAKLQHIDVERDLCQITARNMVAPAVPLGDSGRLTVGQKVYTLGNPKGLELTLSDGLVSALRKDDDMALRYIQTTAPFSHGSSGGGLFDEEGRLVGITTAIAKDAQNVNFAIPINYLKDLPARSAAAIAKRSGGASPGNTGQTPTRTGPVDPHGELQLGESLTFDLTDISGKKRPVVYRVDSIDKKTDRIALNQGGRIEDSKGRVVKLDAVLAGLFESAMPPGGWVDLPLTPGKTWTAAYSVPTLTGKFDLVATVEGEEGINTPLGEFRTTRINWTGWVSGEAVGGGRAMSGASSFKAVVWYSAQLNRVVKFKVEKLASMYNMPELEVFELRRRAFEPEY